MAETHKQDLEKKVKELEAKVKKMAETHKQDLGKQLKVQNEKSGK